MKNYSSRRTVKKGGVRFRTPSLFLVRRAESGKHFKQPLLIKGRRKIG
ncbi:hypothetical protein HYW17_00600 [Candidatus Uhrbacteria bacterium]|nr:hypothetical protein [Candidatus Uhrbacteria bacterium]